MAYTIIEDLDKPPELASSVFNLLQGSNTTDFFNVGKASYFIVTRNNSPALINDAGVNVIHFEVYDSIIYVDSVFLIVSSNGKYGVVDYHNLAITSLTYDYLFVGENGGIYYYDTDGESKRLNIMFNVF